MILSLPRGGGCGGAAGCAAGAAGGRRRRVLELVHSGSLVGARCSCRLALTRPVRRVPIYRARPQGLAFRDLSRSRRCSRPRQSSRIWPPAVISPTRRRISRRRLRHDRQQQDAGDAQRFRDVEQHLRQSRGLRLVPRKRPGLALAMNSLAASTIWKAAATPALEREAVHRLAGSRRRALRRYFRERPGSPAGAAADPPRYFSAIAPMRLTRLPRLFARSTL